MNEAEYIGRIERLKSRVSSLRETINEKIELPNSFYELRSELYDHLAASILICPGRCPTQKQLPRRMLTDEGVKTIMQLARSGRQSEEIAMVAARKIGAWYVDYLIKIISDPHECPFIYLAGWYSNQIRKMEAVYSRHLVLLHELSRVRKASDSF